MIKSDVLGSSTPQVSMFGGKSNPVACVIDIWTLQKPGEPANRKAGGEVSLGGPGT